MINKKADWIVRLHELRATEAEMPPFEPSWQKVEQKLGSKRKSRLPIIYWAAAALLLALMLPRLLQQSDKTQKMIVGRPLPPQQKLNTPLFKRDSIKAISKGSAKNFKKKNATSITPIPGVPDYTDTQNRVLIHPIIPLDSTEKTLLVQKKPKKRTLTVIHENELPDPSQPIQTTANTHYRLIPGYKEYKRPEEPPVHSIPINTQN